MKTIRILHRYIGFFLVGIMFIYALSGIVLTFRNSDIFRIQKHVELNLQPNLNVDQLAQTLRLRHLNIEKETEETLFFKAGQYNKASGVVSYEKSEYPTIISKLVNLHKTPSGGIVSWFTTFFGIALMFLAVSSFWMFKPKTKMFKKAILVATAGIIFTIILVIFS